MTNAPSGLPQDLPNFGCRQPRACQSRAGCSPVPANKRVSSRCLFEAYPLALLIGPHTGDCAGLAVSRCNAPGYCQTAPSRLREGCFPGYSPASRGSKCDDERGRLLPGPDHSDCQTWTWHATGEPAGAAGCDKPHGVGRGRKQWTRIQRRTGPCKAGAFPCSRVESSPHPCSN